VSQKVLVYCNRERQPAHHRPARALRRV